MTERGKPLDLERVILGGWLESLAMDGKIKIEPQRVEDVRTGIRLTMRWFVQPVAGGEKQKR